MAKVLQNAAEFELFLKLLERENVRSYLEIGSKYGDSLVKVAERLPVPSTIVAVDLPWGKKETQPVLEKNIARIRARGHNTVLFIGDSTDPEIVVRVADHAPFDCVFIDANHTLPYVTMDWVNYGPMGRIVAFHDISYNHPPREGRLPIDVPQFWHQIKNGYDYRCEEIKVDTHDNGIGVLWRC